MQNVGLQSVEHNLLFQCHPRPLEESKERKQKIGQVGIKPFETPVLCGILETAQKWFQPKIVVGLFYSAPGSPAPSIQRKGVWRAQGNSCESSSIIVVALRLWLANVKMLAPCDDTSWVPSKLRAHGPVLTVCQNRTADAQKVQHFSFSRGPMDWRKRLEDLKMWMLAIALKHCHCTWHQNVRSATLDSWLFTLHHRIWIFNWLIYGWWRVLMNHCLQVELVTHTRYQGQC